ncbi:MAG: carbamoyltransferase [Bradymonadia bacterium]
MYILGINAFHGDASAALLKDGQLVCAVEEERLNRVKHCAGFPSLAVKACLDQAGIKPEELDHVAIGRDPSANLVRKILFTLLRRPDVKKIVESRLKNAGEVKNVMGHVAEALGVPEHGLRAKLHNVEHHRAHLASTFFASPFEDAALLTIDGFGDFVSTMRGVGHGTHFEVYDQVEFPHSLGILYTATTQWLGFPRYGDEGKVMGLAPYGRVTQLDKFLQLLDLKDDGLFALDLDHFLHHSEGVAMNWDEGSPTLGRIFSEKFIELFGPPREGGTEITDYHMDVAASLQAALEEAWWHLLSGLHEKTGLDSVSLAGGVALNSVANGKILRNTPFKKVFVQPAAGDNGTSLGAALYVWHQEMKKPRSWVMDHAYTGPSYDRAACIAAAEEAGLSYTTYEDTDALCAETAKLISEGNVVGWFQGQMEFGPRALGNRSIVADPRRAEMKDILNARIKQREPFRPFAPSVLEEETANWFTEDHPSPCMLMVYPVRPGKRRKVPAITHVDGSGRLQTVSKRTNPRYWQLIKSFEDITGVPMVLNTSFNENEPVVCTPAHAVACFTRTKMDVLVLGDLIIHRPDR